MLRLIFYSEMDDRLRQAVSNVRQKRMSLRKAAKEFEVPRSTISDSVRGKYKTHKRGPQHDLKEHEETALVNFLLYLASLGFPLSRAMARCYIQDMLKCSGRPVRINLDNGPSDHWFRRLIKRHPQLSERSPENMDRARTSMSNKTIIDKYFLFLEETLMKYGLKDKASQIYNCDETGWSGKEVSRSKVLGPKHGHVFKQRVTSINHITAMLCVSADGRFLPSMMIYQGSLPHRPFTEGIPDSWLFAYSESGFMDGDLFFKWFTRLFIPNCGRTRPVMLLMDNHDSHITKRTVEAARENEIVLVGLPGHTTHTLQPLDVKIIGPLKRRITTMASTMGHASTHQTIGKAKFPSLLRYAVDQTTPASIQAAFAVTGICPFNPTAIDTSQLVPTTFGNNEPENINKEPTRTCEACGSFLVNPLVKKGLVPECMASVLMPPPMKPCTTKNKRVVAEGRVISSKHILEQLKEKEETAKGKRKKSCCA